MAAGASVAGAVVGGCTVVPSSASEPVSEPLPSVAYNRLGEPEQNEDTMCWCCMVF